MQCVTFLIGSVRGGLTTQLQPWAAGEKELSFVVGPRYLCFSFTCMIRASSVLLSYIEGKHCGCWLLVLLTKFGCCSNQTEEIVFFSKKKEKKFSSRPMKRPSTSGSSAAMFLVDMYPDRDSLAPKLPIKWYGSICLVSLERGGAVPFVQKKATQELHWVSTGLEKLGPTRNGPMEWTFPVTPIFRNYRPTSLDKSKISEWNCGNWYLYFLTQMYK